MLYEIIRMIYEENMLHGNTEDCSMMLIAGLMLIAG